MHQLDLQRQKGVVGVRVGAPGSFCRALGVVWEHGPALGTLDPGKGWRGELLSAPRAAHTLGRNQRAHTPPLEAA